MGEIRNASKSGAGIAAAVAVVVSLSARLAAAQDVAALRAMAADLAVQVSSMAATGAGPVVVQEFSGPGERAALLTHLLRAELLRGGAVVAAPDGPADYDLRGGLFSLGGTWQVSAELWRRSQKTLVGTLEREFGAAVPLPSQVPSPSSSTGQTAAPRGAEEAGGRRTFWARAGLAARSSKDASSAGIAYRRASRRWEAGVDVGQFRDANAFATVREHFRFSATYVQLGGSYLHPVDMKYLSYLRAGAGARLVTLNQEHIPAGAGRASTTSNSQRFSPAFEVGAAKGLWGDVELDVRGEWVPEARAVGDLKFGGFAASALLGIRLPI